MHTIHESQQRTPYLSPEPKPSLVNHWPFAVPRVWPRTFPVPFAKTKKNVINRNDVDCEQSLFCSEIRGEKRKKTKTKTNKKKKKTHGVRVASTADVFLPRILEQKRDCSLEMMRSQCALMKESRTKDGLHKSIDFGLYNSFDKLPELCAFK